MEKNHPINQMLEVSLDNISKMVDTGKIIGEPIVLGENKIIIPVSKVSFGFGAAGSEIPTKKKEKSKKAKKEEKKVKEYINFNEEYADEIVPTAPDNQLFGGGSGGGVSITPSAFIVLSEESVEVKSIEQKSHALEKVFEFFSRFINKDNNNNKTL